MRWLLPVIASACGYQPGTAVASDGGTTDVAIDAAVDAPELVCPTTAGWIVVDNAHYYLSPLGSDLIWWKAEADCESRALPGGSATHLAVIASKDQAVALGQFVQAPYQWVGMFQPIGQAQATTGWEWITGATGLAGDWSPNEPNDKDGTENGEENFAEIYTDGTLNDTGGTDVLHYVCSCDGVPASAAAAAMVPPLPPAI